MKEEEPLTQDHPRQMGSEDSMLCPVQDSEPVGLSSTLRKHASTISSFFRRVRYQPLVAHRNSRQRGGQYDPFWILLLYAIAVFAAGATGGVAGYMAGAAHDPPKPERKQLNLGSCGLTSADNRGNSCVYDFVMGSWIHSRCHDEELYRKYLGQVRDLNLTYFADPEATTEVSLDVALQGDHPRLWTSGAQHHLHCSYFWERQWRAWRYGHRAVDSDTRSSEHTLHCISLNGHPRPDELLNPTVTKVYAPEERIECIVD